MSGVRLLGCPIPAAVVTDVASSFPMPGPEDKAVWTLVGTAAVRDRTWTRVVLLAGDGLLMVVNRVRFAVFGPRVLSTLCVANLDGMVSLLMNARPFLPFRSSLDGCRSVMDLDSSRMRN